MKKSNYVVLVCVILCFSLLFMGCGSGTTNQPSGDQTEPPSTSLDGQQQATDIDMSKAEYVIKMHVNQPATDNSYHYVYARYLAEDVAQRTNGKVKIEIYPGAQLGKDPDVIEQMKVGTIQSGMLAHANLINVYKPINIFMLPYLFDDFESASKALNGPTAQKIYADFEATSGLKVLGTYNGGGRGITNSKKAINKIEDFKGLTIRTPGTPVLIKTLEALGASAVSLSGSEIFTALQQGTVDGQESGISWSYGQGYYEVQKYLTETRHSFSGTSYLINANYFNKLPEDIQAALTAAAQDAALYTDGFCKMYDMSSVAEYQNKGLEVTSFSPEEVRPLVTKVWDEFAEEVGGRDLIDSLVADGKIVTK